MSRQEQDPQCHPGNSWAARAASGPKARGWRGLVGNPQINTLSGSRELYIPSSVSQRCISGPVPAHNLAGNLSLEWGWKAAVSNTTSFMGRRKGWGSAALGGVKPAPFVPPKKILTYQKQQHKQCFLRPLPGGQRGFTTPAVFLQAAWNLVLFMKSKLLDSSH